MADVQLRISAELYDQVFKLAQENRRTLKAQVELLIEKGFAFDSGPDNSNLNLRKA